MKFIKNICIISLCVFSLLSINFSYGLNIGPIGLELQRESTPKVSSQEISNIEEGPKSFSDKLKGILNANIPSKSNYTTSLGYALSLITILVNWTLGILASVAVVYMLYCGFLVLSSGSDDKNVSKGKKGISTAAIALAGIGLSWLIISAMIWFIKLITETE